MILDEPKIMGVLNVTPDSFYDGGRFVNEKQILDQTEKMLEEGAHFIDVGGYSTRPGAQEISPSEEHERVTNAIGLISKYFPSAIVSVDTFRTGVARAALDNGALMVNDISGGELDSAMFDFIAHARVPYVLMHMRGNPQTMTKQTSYENLVKELIGYLHKKIFRLRSMGVKDIVIDPGFGFAKTREQNFELLNRLGDFSILGLPILAGLSRKSMVWKTLEVSPEEALNGTTVLNTVALQKGVSILRVHDVKACAEAIRLVRALRANDIYTNLEG